MPHRPPIQLDITLEVLTPAVLGGARPRQVDPYMSLRPASLRGLWRYWFRAIAGSLLWPERDDHGGREMLKALLDAETRLFGDTTRRSRLTLLPPDVTAPRGQQIPQAIPIPEPNNGLRYLGYGLFEDRAKRPPECIPEGSTAQVSCILRSPDDSYADVRAVCATLWVWAAIGGLGGRVRRGWGSLRLTAISANFRDHPELAKRIEPWQRLLALPATPDAHFANLRDGIGQAQDAVTDFLKSEKLGKRQLESDAPGPLESIRTLDGIAEASGLRHTYPTGIAALTHAGVLFRDFRSTLKRRERGQPPLPDYFEVKGSLKHPFNAPRHADRAAFGLPLRFYYRSLDGASTTLNPKLPRSGPERESADRLASPLFFRIYKLKDGKHGVALINLAGKHTAPPLLGCQIVSQKSQDPIPPPSNQIIADFIAWARAQPPPGPPTPGRR